MKTNIEAHKSTAGKITNILIYTFLEAMCGFWSYAPRKTELHIYQPK